MPKRVWCRSQLVVLLVLTTMGLGACARSSRVTHQGVPIDDPFIQDAVRFLSTVEFASVAALDVVTDGVVTGTISPTVGRQAEQTAEALEAGMLEAKTALLAYLAGTASRERVQAAVVPIRALLQALLALTERTP